MQPLSNVEKYLLLISRHAKLWYDHNCTCTSEYKKEEDRLCDLMDPIWFSLSKEDRTYINSFLNAIEEGKKTLVTFNEEMEEKYGSRYEELS